MRSIALLLSSSALILHLAHSLPSPYGLGHDIDDLPPPKPHTTLTCSANQNNAIPDWAANPAWAADMTTCLGQLNNTGWNGAECKPALADGTLLGPSFGFWKGEDNYSDGGLDCYNQCSACLLNGIGWNQAVTTTCEYEYKADLTATKKHCDVGFTYNT